jgi:hypothetical protein
MRRSVTYIVTDAALSSLFFREREQSFRSGVRAQLTRSQKFL